MQNYNQNLSSKVSTFQLTQQNRQYYSNDVLIIKTKSYRWTNNTSGTIYQLWLVNSFSISYQRQVQIQIRLIKGHF